MTISLFPPQHYFLRADHFLRQLTGKLGKHLHQCSWKSSNMPQVPGVWSKNIFGDTTFRTSCCKTSVSGSDWAICKTQLWSSVARLGMPQADQRSCCSFLETSQHLQRVLPVCSGAHRIYGNTCCQQCDTGLPCRYFHQPLFWPIFFTFSSSLNTDLCLMVSISNFQPVSSHYNLILPSDFIFNCDFISYLPQTLSTPLFCLSLCVWQLHILLLDLIPHHDLCLGTQWRWQSCEHCQDTSLWLRASGRYNVTLVALCVLQRGLAESRAQCGVGLKDSQTQQHRGEGVLPILPGAYPCLSRTLCPEEPK